MISMADAFLSSPASAARSAVRALASRVADGRGSALAFRGGRGNARGGLGPEPCLFGLRIVVTKGSAPDLAVAEYDPLLGRQSLEPHRAVRVQLRRRDADFGAEAELAPVVEARRRVDENAARIDFAE